MATHNVTLHVKHISGVKNIGADLLSRFHDNTCRTRFRALFPHVQLADVVRPVLMLIILFKMINLSN